MQHIRVPLVPVLSLFSPMDKLPPELVLHIVQFLTSLNDKCQLSICCQRFHTLLCSHSWCWSPLDFSPYSHRLNNATLLSILKNCSIPCIQPADVVRPVPCSNPTKWVRELDISGCWSLTPGAIHLLACSLPYLETLGLNKYTSKSGDGQWKSFEHREHLYHIQPSHNLSSLAMDLAKEASMGLGLSETTIQQMVKECTEIQTLSLQYQQLGRTACNAIIRLTHLRHLDISSCATDQPVLQILLRNIGHRLLSLKMLNLDLTDLTLISIKQHAKYLKCLHLSCADPSRLISITHVVGSLLYLEDFRMTRLRTGNIDPIIQRLNPSTIKRLDLSPKMDLHPLHSSRPFSRQLEGGRGRVIATGHTRGRLIRNLPTTSTTTATLPHQQQQQTMATATRFTRTEHELDMTDQSFSLLAQRFSALVELRICYPRLHDPESMTAFLTAVAPRLQILELRLEMQKNNNHNYSNGRSTTTAEANLTPLDMLQGLRHVQMPQLHELGLYHTWMSQATAYALGYNLRQLTHMTIYNCGRLVDSEPDLVRFWLLSHPRLQELRLGRLGHIRCDILQDIAVPEQHGEAEHNKPTLGMKNTNSVDGEMMFKKRLSPGEQIFVYTSS